VDIDVRTRRDHQIAMNVGMAEALVDLSAIAHNTRLLSRASGRAALMAVVKANGFGHGTEPVARTALEHGARWLGVATAAEALSLRAAGIDAPVLMWLHSPGQDLEPVLRDDVEISVSSTKSLDLLAEQARAAGLVVGVHLKVDTGLSRNGAHAGEWPELLAVAARYQAMGAMRIRGIWSHLGHAEDLEDPRSASQLRIFRWAVDEALALGLDPQWCHLANSAAILQLPHTHFDLTRAGIGLYGVDPLGGQSSGLRPAMTLQATIALTKQIKAGTEVSYGPDWRAERDTTLALVPLGFADGIPRRSWRHAEAWVNGFRCRIAGRITMDQFMLDVGDLPVSAGDRVVIFGPGHEGEPTVGDWATWADTNPHEILTSVSARVPRRYLPAPTPDNTEF